MKKMLAVQHADGTREGICPKCDSVMKFTTTGSMHFGRGEVWDDIEEYFVCPACGYQTDQQEDLQELQEKETLLIDLILDEGKRDGLFSMAEHPRYQELVELQERIEGIEKSEGTAIHTDMIAEKVPQWAKSLEKA